MHRTLYWPITVTESRAYRICPGKLLGEASIFILIATLLATLDISPPPEGGQLWVPEFEKQLVRYVAGLKTIYNRR